MPRFDGTGPQGQGPMTGRGEGYCAVELPRGDQPASGYVGLQGGPVAWPRLGARFARRLRPAMGRGFRRGRGGAARGGRGRRGRW